jgi:hypothetical protein
MTARWAGCAAVVETDRTGDQSPCIAVTGLTNRQQRVARPEPCVCRSFRRTGDKLDPGRRLDNHVGTVPQRSADAQ